MLLEKCLKSIFKFADDLKIEVIVIDNDSGDGTVEMVQQNFPQVQLTASQVNLGFAKANNLGLKQARGRQILLLNPDTEFIGPGLSATVKYLDKHQEVGVLGCQLLNFDNSPQPSVRRFPGLCDHLLMMFKLHHLFKLKKYLAVDFDYNRLADVDQIMGAWFMISRRALTEVGLLDEGYYIWFEEVDYCRRVKKSGLAVRYWPGLAIKHYGGKSFKQVGGFKKQRIYSQSRLRYIWRHENFFVWLLILILTPLSLLLSAVNFKNV